MLRVAISDCAVEAVEPSGITSPCVVEARRLIEAAGCKVQVFAATGPGGRALEQSVRDGQFDGVLDLSLTELAAELAGSEMSAGPDRMTAAALRGIPQVIVPAAVDRVSFGSPESTPEKFRTRRFYSNDSRLVLMRTTPEENDRLGREIALKVSAAAGPAAILLPLQGVSALDRVGQSFWWPDADHALFQSIRNWISPHVRLIELDLHVNDPAFARTSAEMLLEMLVGTGARSE